MFRLGSVKGGGAGRPAGNKANLGATYRAGVSFAGSFLQVWVAIMIVKIVFSM